MDIFSTRLKELMAEPPETTQLAPTDTEKPKKITQVALANYIGVKRQTISLYTKGQSIPDKDKLAKIAEYFNVNPAFLLGTSDTPTLDTENFQITNAIGLSETSINYLRKAYEGLQRFYHTNEIPIEIPIGMDSAEKYKEWDIVASMTINTLLREDDTPNGEKLINRIFDYLVYHVDPERQYIFQRNVEISASQFESMLLTQIQTALVRLKSKLKPQK
ncbi:MAG: helix-turn-helix domain-containing protein [Firmicutes bacterium]|nr:helix-turn-helix domain-containing protein [Bacillota bacterium]